MLGLGLEVTLCMEKYRGYLLNGRIVPAELHLTLRPGGVLSIQAAGICYRGEPYGSVEGLVTDGIVDPSDKHLIELVRHALLWVRGE